MAVNKYKVIGLEPWVNTDNVQMMRLYCVTRKEGVSGLATVATSIRSDRIPSDLVLDSVVLLGFERQGKYLEFVYVLPPETPGETE